MSRRWASLAWRLGEITVVIDGAGRLLRIRFGPAGREDGREDRAACAPAIGQLAQYLAGRRSSFDLPVAAWGPPFSRRVWAELTRIPYGSTATYGELARRLGRPRAARAVGRAAAANPVPIVIPCHRLVAAGGLGGYSAGLPIKRALLELEGAIPRT